jgi:hypothetical protein
MQCLILHASGSQSQIIAAVAEAVNGFAAMNVVKSDGFSAHYAGIIRIVSTDRLDEAAIKKRLKGAEICIVDNWYFHQIFVDCRTPKITVAGWYNRYFQFGEYFPRCTFMRMPRPPPHPLARYAQFYLKMQGLETSLRSCEFLPEWTEKLKSHGRESENLRFISIINGDAVEKPAKYFNPLDGPSFICGVPPATEFTMTGEGRHEEYTVLSWSYYSYSLVDAKVIILR